MELVILIGCTLGAMAVLLLVRNEVTFELRGKAIRRASDLSKVAISRQEPWQVYYDILEEKSYNSVLFDLRVWSAEKAYPELFKQSA